MIQLLIAGLLSRAAGDLFRFSDTGGSGVSVQDLINRNFRLVNPDPPAAEKQCEAKMPAIRNKWIAAGDQPG